MLCEKYKEALIEAAVSGGELAPDVSAHVTACTSCAAELVQQRSLVGAIAADLSRKMNAPVPAATIQRLEARLAQEPQPQSPRSLRVPWLYTAAAFATAAALIVFATPKLRTHKPNPQTVALSQEAPSQTARPTTDDRPQMIPLALKPAAQPEPRRVTHHAQAVGASQPEILVPPDEQIALTKFVARRNARRAFVVALAASIHHGLEPSFKGLEIPDINTAGIVIEPIATETRR
jgi:hypothetical protein